MTTIFHILTLLLVILVGYFAYLLIFPLTILLGYILDALVLLALSPTGFLLIFFSLIFGEYLIIKNVAQDLNTFKAKEKVEFALKSILCRLGQQEFCYLPPSKNPV